MILYNKDMQSYRAGYIYVLTREALVLTNGHLFSGKTRSAGRMLAWCIRLLSPVSSRPRVLWETIAFL